MVDVRKLRLPERLFALSVFALIFGYGVAVGRFELFPFRIIQLGWKSAYQVFSEREMLLGLRPTEFLRPARYAGSGVTRSLPEAVPGLTLLSGFFDGGNQLRLVRLDGSVVHKWPVQYFDLFTDANHVQPDGDVPKTNWNTSVHGALALPDGSIVFNFDSKGTVRLDRCGRALWTIKQMTHHAVSPASDGSFWIPSARYITADSRFPFMHPPYRDDTLLKVSAGGEVLAEISILDVLYRNNLQGMLYWKLGTGDVTHLNDVEELSPELAPRFPMFAAGDLLVSTRMQNLVLVMDPKTLVVKWFQSGPWLGQHDPDFLPSGRIMVFNNNNDDRSNPDGARHGGSNIIEFDPATRVMQFRYGAAADQRMFTDQRGHHEALPGGHLLITESHGGRVFEVNTKGEIVWEFVNRYDETDTALIAGATRYPENYFKVGDWTCR